MTRQEIRQELENDPKNYSLVIEIVIILLIELKKSGISFWYNPIMWWSIIKILRPYVINLYNRIWNR